MKYLHTDNLIHDKDLKNIPVKENNEFMNLCKASPKIKVENVTADYMTIPKDSVYLRKEVYVMLEKAVSFLPKNYTLLVVDGFRPVKWQLERFLRRYCIVKKKYPTLSFDEVFWKASQWTAPVWGIVPPHTTGGAVDLTLLHNGQKVDMGTKVNEFNAKTKTLCHGISKEQKANRKLLMDAMHKAGFINYPTEWWHWSYGDQYWAAINKTTSIYDTIEVENE